MAADVVWSMAALDPESRFIELRRNLDAPCGRTPKSGRIIFGDRSAIGEIEKRLHDFELTCFLRASRCPLRSKTLYCTAG
jgi:hypothetical protein